MTDRRHGLLRRLWGLTESPLFVMSLLLGLVVWISIHDGQTGHPGIVKRLDEYEASQAETIKAAQQQRAITRALAQDVKNRMDRFEARQAIVDERYACILMDADQDVDWLAWCDENASAGVKFSNMSAAKARRQYPRNFNEEKTS